MADSAQLLRESWKQVAALRDAFPLLFYAVLMDMAPDVAQLFPIDMSEQRRHLVATLGLVANAEPTDEPIIEERLLLLGADHRRYGAGTEHYATVGDALLLTLGHLVPEWTSALADAWARGYEAVAQVMAAGAGMAAVHYPPWVEVGAVERVGQLDEVAIHLDADPHLGPDVWARRPERFSRWHRATVEFWSHNARPVEPVLVAPLDGLDAIVLSQTPRGARLLLAPVYTQEMLRHA